jgi:hypothetical protein
VTSNVVKVDNWSSPNFWFDGLTHHYKVKFDLTKCPKDFVPQVGQYYKIQLACIDNSGNVGYYSTVGIIKCTSSPVVKIKDRDNKKVHTYDYTGEYSQAPTEEYPDRDNSEKVYSYCFNLYNEANELVATSGTLIHDNSTDPNDYSSFDTWTVNKSLEPNVSYSIEYIVTTINGLEIPSGRYQIVDAETILPTVHADLTVTNDFENGYMKIALKGDKSNSFVSGRFLLLRSSSEDNYENWYQVTQFELIRFDSNTVKEICKDYTVQQGFHYKYAIRAFNSVGLYSDKLLNIEGPVQCDFEDAFLYDGERQLKIRYNTKVNNFKSTVLETKTNTIGGKYPFIFRNGNVEYKEF